MKSPAIYNYGRNDVSQAEIDEATLIMNQCYIDLKDLKPGEDISQEVIDKVDEINGEII